MSHLWKLGGSDGRTPEPTDDILEWGRAFQDTGLWTVQKTRLRSDDHGEVTVSTVFLGVDHNFGGQGPPLLFESMIFGEAFEGADEYQTRSATWDEALEQHAQAIRYVRRLELGLRVVNGE